MTDRDGVSGETIPSPEDEVASALFPRSLAKLPALKPVLAGRLVDLRTAVDAGDGRVEIDATRGHESITIVTAGSPFTLTMPADGGAHAAPYPHLSGGSSLDRIIADLGNAFLFESMLRSGIDAGEGAH